MKKIYTFVGLIVLSALWCAMCVADLFSRMPTHCHGCQKRMLSSDVFVMSGGRMRCVSCHGLVV